MDYLQKLKIISIFVVFICSLIGVYLPFCFTKNNNTDNIFIYGKAFSGGIMLGVGFVHIFEEAVEHLAEAYPKLEYPLTGFIAGLSCICIMALENYVNKLFHEYNVSNDDNNEHNDASNDIELHITNTDTQQIPNTELSDNNDEEHGGHTHCHTINALYEHHNMHLKDIITVYILELGIAVHSIVLGISLGVFDETDTFTSLFVAILVHQLFEGIALGMSIVKANITTIYDTIPHVMIFTLVTPIGVIIGYFINDSYASSTTFDSVQGVLSACAAGVLIYMALIHMIVEDFTNHHFTNMQKNIMLLFILLGYGVMCALALWGHEGHEEHEDH